LRPVQFRYKKADASGEKPIQYGLIAEEVAEVYPELVVRDATTGRIDGVRYDELAPMLLNEVQHQQSKIAAQAERMAAQAEKIEAQATINTEQAERIAAQAVEIRGLKKQQLVTQAEQLRTQQQMAVMSAALQKLQGKDALVAQR
jgi:hypothetical protein